MWICARGAIVAAVSAALLFAAAPSALAIAEFGDVAADEYFAAPVQWMVDGNITVGTSPGCFSPTATASRGQVATFIHRTSGSPPGGSEPFVDVAPGDYFRDSVAWMVAEGITSGTTSTTFEPRRAVTRGEVATFLHRSEGSPTGGATPFVDVSAGSFYAEAVAWMVGVGITTGTTATTFEPSRPVTRAEVATFLYRLVGEPNVLYTVGGECLSASLSVQLDVAEAWSLHLLNGLRETRGLAPLSLSRVMDIAARDWSETMDRTGDFTHSDLPYGENIAWRSRFSESPETAAQNLHNQWVNSPGHYRNMMLPEYRSIGVGFWRSSNGWYATHVFSRLGG